LNPNSHSKTRIAKLGIPPIQKTFDNLKIDQEQIQQPINYKPIARGIPRFSIPVPLK
jgi:hypothetical protein